MKKIKDVTRGVMTAIALFCMSLSAQAAEVVYKIVEYNKTTQDFLLAASGMVPKNSYADFENTYGATTGNRYNQIPRNRNAVLYLNGWQGCTIKSITLSMCSNNTKGQVGMTVKDGETQLYKQAAVDFASPDWFGQWVSKDLNVYVDIKKELNLPAITTDEASIVVQGGTKEGSVYLDAITIEYDEAAGTQLESPLGWIYEKMEKKGKLNEGDELMIYRNGCAATDYDGMKKDHYLDVVTIASTKDVTSPDVLRFTLGKGESNGFWTLTDQYGRKLGATGKQTLAWNEGSTQWAIDLGYEGATISNEKESSSTLRYNEPTSSYARFALYTSKSLQLPFLYRKDKQKEPELSRSITFSETTVTAALENKHVVLAPTVMPTTTTDKRMVWSSSDERVATVNGGFVTLLATGHTTITAKTKDGGAEASVSLTVTTASGIGHITAEAKKQATRKVLNGHNIVIVTDNAAYGVDGAKR